MEVDKEKILHILQFFFVKGKNISQVAEIVNHIYDPVTVAAYYVQFLFRRFHSDNFYDKDASRTDRLVVKNFDKITEIIKVGWHFSSRSIAQELEIDEKTVLNLLHKAGFKNKLDVWVPQQLTFKA